MRTRTYRFAAAALVALIAVAGTALASGDQKTVPIESTSPGMLGKTLEVTGIDKDKARLTIVGKNGSRNSIVVYGGDVRLGLYTTGVSP